MNNYFNSSAIGSSLLGECILSTDPLLVCTDRATKEVKPTAFMEAGKMFEDLVEAEYGDLDFWEKYFKSNFKTMPSGVIEILDADDLIAAIENCIGDPSHYKLDGGLKKTYERKIAYLNQIKAHDYRRPIPEPLWERLGIMLERFKSYPFELEGVSMTLGEWMSADWLTVEFQVEHFWKTGDAECRAKFDMIWVYQTESGESYAIPWDLKVTGDEVQGQKSFGAFIGNWKKKYIWQSKHYHEGFKDWCQKNGHIPHDRIYYAVQESEEPQITHVWYLHPDILLKLDAPYREALPIIQKWIDEDKPAKGFMEQRAVDEYGRVWE